MQNDFILSIWKKAISGGHLRQAKNWPAETRNFCSQRNSSFLFKILDNISMCTRNKKCELLVIYILSAWEVPWHNEFWTWISSSLRFFFSLVEVGRVLFWDFQHAQQVQSRGGWLHECWKCRNSTRPTLTRRKNSQRRTLMAQKFVCVEAREVGWSYVMNRKDTFGTTKHIRLYQVWMWRKANAATLVWRFCNIFCNVYARIIIRVLAPQTACFSVNKILWMYERVYLMQVYPDLGLANLVGNSYVNTV